MKILGIIPARYASTRFPAKPLAEIAGKSMIEWVYSQALKSRSLITTVVATDDSKIFDHVSAFGGVPCMTSTNHVSGTDRCFEALTKQTTSFDYVINIQGDEPFIAPEQIDLLAQLLDGQTEIATLAKKVADADEIFNTNVVKVTKDIHGRALYFSRSPVPHVRHASQDAWSGRHSFYKHIGMYAYRADILKKITQLPVSSLEKAESLEQLRWLENGYTIKVAETDHETIGVDTPEDLQKAIAFLKIHR